MRHFRAIPYDSNFGSARLGLVAIDALFVEGAFDDLILKLFDKPLLSDKPDRSLVV
jgi:hypothetical protein